MHEHPVDDQSRKTERQYRKRQRDGMNDRLDGGVNQREEQRECRDAENGRVADGVHAGQQRDHDPGRYGEDQPTGNEMMHTTIVVHRVCTACEH